MLPQRAWNETDRLAIVVASTNVWRCACLSVSFRRTQIPSTRDDDDALDVTEDDAEAVGGVVEHNNE